MNDLTPVPHRLTRADRVRRYGHAGAVVWLTGLSAAGKTTLALALEVELTRRGYACFVLDGDALRNRLNADLGFDREDRAENVRRAGEVAALFADAGLVCIAAFISPFEQDRRRARAAWPHAFHEVHIAADVATCEQRDPKGLYAKARRGVLPDFPGVNSAYEIPAHCELRLETGTDPLGRSLDMLLQYVLRSVPIEK